MGYAKNTEMLLAPACSRTGLMRQRGESGICPRFAGAVLTTNEMLTSCLPIRKESYVGTKLNCVHPWTLDDRPVLGKLDQALHGQRVSCHRKEVAWHVYRHGGTPVRAFPGPSVGSCGDCRTL